LFFQADYDKIKLQKISYDVMTIMSPKNVTKKRQKFFSFWAHPQSKFLATPVVIKHTILWTYIIEQNVSVSPIVYRSAQQKLRYEIVKNRLRNIQNGYILTSKLQIFFNG